MLTGHPPFVGGTLPQRLMMHQKEPPPSIFLDRADAPPDLVAICMKMMAKKPDERYQSADEVAEALAQWLVAHGQRVEAAGGSGWSVGEAGGGRAGQTAARAKKGSSPRRRPAARPATSRRDSGVATFRGLPPLPGRIPSRGHLVGLRSSDARNRGRRGLGRRHRTPSGTKSTARRPAARRRTASEFVLDESLRPPADLWMELDMPKERTSGILPAQEGHPRVALAGRGRGRRSGVCIIIAYLRWSCCVVRILPQHRLADRHNRAARLTAPTVDVKICLSRC